MSSPDTYSFTSNLEYDSDDEKVNTHYYDLYALAMSFVDKEIDNALYLVKGKEEHFNLLNNLNRKGIYLCDLTRHLTIAAKRCIKKQLDISTRKRPHFYALDLQSLKNAPCFHYKADYDPETPCDPNPYGQMNSGKNAYGIIFIFLN